MKEYGVRWREHFKKVPSSMCQVPSIFWHFALGTWHFLFYRRNGGLPPPGPPRRGPPKPPLRGGGGTKPSGGADICFRDMRVLPSMGSYSTHLAFTSWPTFKTSSTFSVRDHWSSEMWIMASLPRKNSTIAPVPGMMRTTLQSYTARTSGFATMPWIHSLALTIASPFVDVMKSM